MINIWMRNENGIECVPSASDRIEINKCVFLSLQFDFCDAG